ncbi:unnamed protein product [Schistocephalus solidus]|uniref:Uncharacterized protein n=1 Tax=Schistocephalus solidus TaxID=70667 RepID=A0A183SPR2_SCHSO|nr:unnamed protein product [Schistocephalus solidus]
MIFSVLHLQKKCQEMQFHHRGFEKVFDTENHEGNGKSVQKFGRPGWLTHLVRQLHDNMMARVTDDRTVSEVFAVTNRLKQSCKPTPILLSFRFSIMMMDAYGDEHPEILIGYRTDGYLLNNRRMQVQRVYLRL